MSHTAQIRSHRKHRARSASTIAMRTGVAGGVLSTLAVAGASAYAAEPVAQQTLELPTLTADLSTQVAQSAEATQLAAANYQLQAERDAAAAQAAKQAKANLAEAKKKAAEAKRKAEAERKTAEAASRSAERAVLTAASASTSASTASVSQATGSASAVIAFVKAQLGDAYVSGSTGPNSWDCSGLVQTAFKQVGVSLPRVSQDQSTVGTQVSLSNLQPGDILYWGGAGSAYHVAVYVGDGMFVGAQNPSTGVVERPLSYDPPSGAVRVL
ncbi:C40 family peptidase [Streptomyces nodosus]|uniref:Glycoside hydrolase n=1 Tax=Streptomyces nodosus TaxID=40318 RepID=A0A0B5DFB7_9ACTN|nr:C40 family peptidase [Streptomyces nodosus]AJE41919.1 glycoside hydrolase [Streptomyces nodosus]MBB4793161.1 cell wall-associated NlpC family hydrolase [Streptomyces nodosus]QEV43371.1 NlpC/P60 family protein [Streptomyces nodosus]